MIDILKKIRHKVPKMLSDHFEKKAKIFFMSKHDLWTVLNEYLMKTRSSGCEFSDYFIIYKHIREKHPVNILECGTGVSTLIMAHALKENLKDGYKVGKIVSMEENEQYYNQAVEFIPREYSDIVDIVLSKPVEKYFGMFRGIGYKGIPDIEYNFVFIDGPSYMANPDKGILTFNFDLIEIAQKSKSSITAFVDTRTTTCFVYRLIFGDKFFYDYVRKLGIIQNVTQADVKTTKEIIIQEMSHRIFKRPRLLQFFKGSY